MCLSYVYVPDARNSDTLCLYREGERVYGLGEETMTHQRSVQGCQPWLSLT